jgi:hypothetical protein
MDDIYNIRLVESVLNFLHTYPVKTYAVTDKIQKGDKYIRIMRKYIDIPEIWIREVDVVFSDMIAVLMRSSPQHLNGDNEAFKKRALETRTELCERLPAFERARREWLREHPQELEFVFNKMRYKGFTNVREWGVTTACQFKEITAGALVDKLFRWDTESEETKHVIELYGKIQNNDADVLSLLKTYKHNDVYSIDLRRQLMHLHEDIKRGQYQETTSRALSTFLLEAVYKLWGWSDFDTQSPDGSTVPRDVGVLKVTGPPGSKANTLNGMYVETKEEQNGRSIFKKTSMHRGTQLWLRYNPHQKWAVSRTQDVKDNNARGLCCTMKKGLKAPLSTWEVFDADGEKQWKTYPDFKCEQSNFPDLLWVLDDCDVAINALPAGEIQNLMNKLVELRSSLLDMDVIQRLDGVLQTLQRMLTARNAPIPVEPGECGKCLEHQASEILLPCHHVILCSNCSKGLTECPYCRQPIDASCNFGVYMTRTSHTPKKIWIVTKPMDEDAGMNSLLQQLRDLHERV